MTDIVIIGAGAAGLAAAIFARRADPGRSVTVLEGAKKPGAKILVSGGGRCNVTNASVRDTDFWGGRRAMIRRVLRAFPVPETIAFFQELGVALHEEAHGKLFPDSNRARDVLDALLCATRECGAELLSGHRVLDVQRRSDGFRVVTSLGEREARTVVLATGGQSLPKSGSDGAGFEMAMRLGHTIVPATPGLVPLVIDTAYHDPDPKGSGHRGSGYRGSGHRGSGYRGSGYRGSGYRSPHSDLSGVAQDAELTIWIDGAVAERLNGALLWTHFGVSGPLALDASRHWARAQLEGRPVRVTINFCAGESFDTVDARWTALGAQRQKTSVANALASIVPASVAAALLERLGIDGAVALAHFTRADRRALAHALVEWPLAVAGTRGYTYAEVTAGGVALTEIDPSTMESRVCPGLYLVGEILDVDGRIGGFNFQWAWASGRVAGRALGVRR